MKEGACNSTYNQDNKESIFQPRWDMLFIIEWNIFMFAVDFLSYTVQGVTLGFEMYLFQNYRVPINVEKKIQLIV